MIGEEIRRFVEAAPLAIVASADADGHPHLALGGGIRVLDGDHLAVENWFCSATVENLDRNPHVAVAVLTQESGTGYQFIGRVTREYDLAILNGYAPGAEAPGEPQTLTRLVVRVDSILAFCSGIHTDRPLVG